MSFPIAARLLGFAGNFAQHVADHPEFFPTSWPRRIAIADIEAHALRQGRKVAGDELLLTAEIEMANRRARWRRHNLTRKS